MTNRKHTGILRYAQKGFKWGFLTMNKYSFYTALLMLLGITTSIVPLSLAQLPHALTAKTTVQKPASHQDFMHECAGLIQHYAFISHNLVAVTLKNKLSAIKISQKHQVIVDKINNTYQRLIEEMRSKIFANDPMIQKNAFITFGNHILGLCNEFGVRDNYLMTFPAQLDLQASNEEQLVLIKKAIAALEILFNKIKPMPPLYQRIADILFYNVVSTKIIPKTISYGVGPALAIGWSVYNAVTYTDNIEQHPHKNIFKKYVPIEHNTTITWVKKPTLIQAVRGAIPEEETINPCQTYDYDHPNICNGKQSAIHKANGDLVRWASQCYGAEDGCYHNQGLHSNMNIIGKLAWAARPAAAIPLCYLLGKFLEDIQLPKYEARLREKEKQEQEKKVQAEMRHMKINYEQHIGFAQIKGQKELIDRELKMIVDYLKNPLRYKNSTSGTRSILFYGPPGTGKTLMARAIAKESGAPFLEITADDILHDNAKEKILATMRLAEDVASKRPEKSAIIYIDEIDCVTGNRQDGTLDPQRAKALSNLLTIFDGIEKRIPFVHIMIIITTNHYKNLDPALLRPGRIDRKILITQPNADGRREFFDSLLPAEHKHLMEWLVKETDGYSGAQIVNIVDTAQMIASYAGRSKPSEDDYKAALQNCKAEYNTVSQSA